MLDGAPLWSSLDRDNFGALAHKVTDWLHGLVQTDHPVGRTAYWPRLVEPVLAQFEATYGPATSPAALAAARRLLDRLGDLPSTIEQRDMSPWNVMLDRAGELVILDWESAELAGLPVGDLAYFLTYLCFFVEGTMKTRRFGPAYRAALDPHTFTGGVFTACQSHYARRVGLDPGCLQPLRLLSWMHHAGSEYRRLQGTAGSAPGVEALRDSLFLTLWHEELQHAHGS